jgi:hypothetical protein
MQQVGENQRSGAEGPAAGLTMRLAGVLRPLVHAGIAGALAGLLVGGIGGRIVMRLSAIAGGPDVVGTITENGNAVGQITAKGTLGLLVFGGLFSGIAGGVILAIVAPWLRWAGPVRGLVFGVFVLAVAGRTVIDASNPDFVILQPAWLNVVMFSALFLLFGVPAVFLLDRLERRPSTSRGGIALLMYAPLLAVGSLVAVPTLGFFLSRTFCSCFDPPLLVGVSLLVAGVATGWTSIAAIRGHQGGPPRAARFLGWIGVGGAFVAGSLTTAREITAIL